MPYNYDMDWYVPSILSALITTLFVVGVYLVLYKVNRSWAILLWALGWTGYGIRLGILYFLHGDSDSIGLEFLNQFFSLLSLFLIFTGAMSFFDRPVKKIWMGFFILGLCYITGGALAGITSHWFHLPFYIFLAVTFARIGFLFLFEKTGSDFFMKMSGISFLMWGLLEFDYVLFAHIEILSVVDLYIHSFLLMILPVSLLFSYYRVSRHDLGESRKLKNLIFENSRDVILIHEISDEFMPGKYIDVNSAALKLFGYSLSEFKTMTPLDLVSIGEADVNKVREGLKRSGHSIFERTMTAKSGKEIPMELYSSLVTLDGKKVVIVLGRDLSERKKQEAMLLDSLKEWEATFNSVNEMILTHDTQYRIVRVNKSFQENFSHEDAPCIGKDCRDVVGCQDCEEKNRACDDVFETGKTKVVERFDAVRKKHYQITCSPIEEKDGSIHGIVKVLQDITYFKNTEKLEKTHKECLLEAEKTASLGVLAGSIAHEINQPLNAIKITADSILYWEEDNRGVLPEMFVKMLSTISGSVDRIDSIIRYMRSFRLGSATREGELLHIDEVVKKVISVTDQQFKAHGIDLETKFEEPDLQVFASRLHLEQIFIHVLAFSRQAMDRASTDEKKIIISIGKKDRKVVVSVADTSGHFTDPELETVFEPFFNSDQFGDQGNTGLGLAIVKSYVDKEGGQIHISNNDMNGKTFTLSFLTP